LEFKPTLRLDSPSRTASQVHLSLIVKTGWEGELVKWFKTFKGIVPQKMKMMSLMTHPHVIPSP